MQTLQLNQCYKLTGFLPSTPNGYSARLQALGLRIGKTFIIKNIATLKHTLIISCDRTQIMLRAHEIDFMRLELIYEP